MASDIHPEIIKAVPGTIGAIVALRWIAGTWPQRLTALVGGSAASYYGSPHLVALSGANPGLSGFLIGLFGMAVAARIFDGLAALKLGALAERVLSRLLDKLGL